MAFYRLSLNLTIGLPFAVTALQTSENGAKTSSGASPLKSLVSNLPQPHDVRILGEPIPEDDLALIAIGPALLAVIGFLFHRTRCGVLVRAATQDRETVGALCVNQAWLFSSTFLPGSFLAGPAGALQIPRQAVSLQMDMPILVEAFSLVGLLQEIARTNAPDTNTPRQTTPDSTNKKSPGKPELFWRISDCIGLSEIGIWCQERHVT